MTLLGGRETGAGAGGRGGGHMQEVLVTHAASPGKNINFQTATAHVIGGKGGEGGGGSTMGPLWPGELHEVLMVQLLLMKAYDNGHYLPHLIAQVRLSLPQILHLCWAQGGRRLPERLADLPAATACFSAHVAENRSLL